MKKTVLYLVILLNFSGVLAQDTFKTMFYNLLNFPLQEPANARLNELEIILTDYQPDLFMVCELNNSSGANTILSMMQQSINTNYQMANFVSNTSDDNIGDQNDLQNLIYYDSSKFTLESQTEIGTLFRDFNHYVLKLNTVNQTSNPIILNVIVCHLKASSGSDNEQLRLQMAQDLTSYLNGFSSSEYFLLAGDFNVYSNSEPAFQEFIDTNNNITFVDPANRIGNWHNNVSFVDVFTQSTRTTTSLGGSSGGFDDRFDFIMTSTSLDNNTELKFVPNSYQVFGNNNNSNCWNSAINSTDCSGALFSQTIRESLHNFSDHLPVTLTIETNQSFLSTPEVTFIQPTFEIVGTNMVSTTIDIKINKQPTFATNINIYNTLGQMVTSIPINDKTITVDISYLSEGIYYISLPNVNVQPLKFVKVH
ncbi:T9SS type A sorting domain-containing protein [Olleya aquimaris]|uniref:Putative secreted protein (Por secretion system target) n=1 Tax=Olleya aquimaris TaxID=639310 RepID=A0A327R6R5_9FLAO|nr:T9SS type A sorting domain-containing protein [Olleya aquimaris]RAJ11855.1 putative secreted protein (Por secretion system target) [Olleya aquimaris]